jgi:hypothetical protein
MPFVSFVDVLQHRKFFFSRLETLADPHEGFYSADMKNLLEEKVPSKGLRMRRLRQNQSAVGTARKPRMPAVR